MFKRGKACYQSYHLILDIILITDQKRYATNKHMCCDCNKLLVISFDIIQLVASASLTVYYKFIKLGDHTQLVKSPFLVIFSSNIVLFASENV